MALSLLDLLTVLALALGAAWAALAVLGYMTHDTAAQAPDPLDYLDLSDLVDADMLLEHRARVADHDVLRSAVDLTDTAMWRVAHDGTVDWHNRAYDRLLTRHGFDPEHLHTVPDLFTTQAGDGDIGTTCRRVSLTDPDGSPFWFDLRATRTDAGRVHAAAPVTATLEAETSTRAFVQTMAATFAQLRVGLAMFDSARQLTLFNPALIDLTGMDAAWLASRPRLDAFFDRLRDDRILPEPRKYADLRTRLDRLEQAATADGGYQDLWSLPDGRSFRVQARPHPNNGLALLIEDISDDLESVRALHRELDAARKSVARLRVPVAVVTRTGGILHANPAFEQLSDKLPAEMPGPTQPETREIALTDGRSAELEIAPLDQDMWLLHIYAQDQHEDLLRAAG